MTEKPQQKPQDKKLQTTQKQQKPAQPKAAVPEVKTTEQPTVNTTDNAKQESQPEQKQEEKKSVKPVKKEFAVVRGLDLPISKKHGMYLCSFIKNKTMDAALAELDQVLKFKRAVPFKGEIPHRKGNIMSGRYPINATKEFITLLKGLKGNSVVNGLDLGKTRIYEASTSWASRPGKKGGARFKRAHVVIKAKEIA